MLKFKDQLNKRINQISWFVLITFFLAGLAWAAYTDVSTLRINAKADDSYLIYGNNSSGTNVFSVDTSGNIVSSGNYTGIGFTRTVTATIETATLAASASGNVIDNYGATGLVTVGLPAWESGLTYTFTLSASQKFRVWPQTGDHIEILTNTAGDMIEADLQGESVTLVATGTNSWTVQSSYGTWTDVN